MAEKLSEILNPLINLPTEFAEPKYIGDVCIICGFPFSKKVRERAVTQVTSKIKSLFKSKLPKKKEIKKDDWNRDNCPMTFGDVLYAENTILTKIEKIVEEL